MTTTPRNLACPHCAQALELGSHATLPFHSCRGCGGVWLDNDVSRAIAQHADAVMLAMVERAASQAAPFAALSPRPSCPACASPLERARVAAVDVDICRAHGTWFDREELHAVARVFEADRAAKADGGAAPPRPLVAPCLTPSDVQTAAYGAIDENTAGNIAADVTLGIVGFLIECALD